MTHCLNIETFQRCDVTATAASCPCKWWIEIFWCILAGNSFAITCCLCTYLAQHQLEVKIVTVFIVTVTCDAFPVNFDVVLSFTSIMF